MSAPEDVDAYAPVRQVDGTCRVCRRYTDEAHHGVCVVSLDEEIDA